MPFSSGLRFGNFICLWGHTHLPLTQSWLMILLPDLGVNLTPIDFQVNSPGLESRQIITFWAFWLAIEFQKETLAISTSYSIFYHSHLYPWSTKETQEGTLSLWAIGFTQFIMNSEREEEMLQWVYLLEANLSTVERYSASKSMLLLAAPQQTLPRSKSTGSKQRLGCKILKGSCFLFWVLPFQTHGFTRKIMEDKTHLT